MNDTKIIKTICAKTGKYFALEVKQFGGEYRVVNMVELSGDEADHIASEIRVKALKSAENLLPCSRCGSRTVMGCACARSAKCSKNTPYHFQCLYCKEMCFDNTGAKAGGPYTQWAGISNIPDAAKDRFGNAAGSQYDLAQDGSFAGYKIVIVVSSTEKPKDTFSKAVGALTQKGFSVTSYYGVPDVQTLSNELTDACQLWYIADHKQHITDAHVHLIDEYFSQGYGIYIWGDNEPYFVDANIICRAIFGTYLSGNSRGDQVLGVQTRPNGPGIIPDHLITTGLTSFYEGDTIAEVHTTQELNPLLYSSESKVLATYYEKNQKRAIIDGGYTRLYCGWDRAGTDRYVVNAAAWLANVERFGYIEQ